MTHRQRDLGAATRPDHPRMHEPIRCAVRHRAAVQQESRTAGELTDLLPCQTAQGRYLAGDIDDDGRYELVDLGMPRDLRAEPSRVGHAEFYPPDPLAAVVVSPQAFRPRAPDHTSRGDATAWYTAASA